MIARMIVTPRLNHTKQINDIGFDKFEHEHAEYRSVDYCYLLFMTIVIYFII